MINSPNNNLTQDELNQHFLDSPGYYGHKNYTPKWGRRKELQLAKMVKENKSLKEMCKFFNRSDSAISQKIHESGFLCLSHNELQYFGVNPGNPKGMRVRDEDCTDHVKRMRKLYPDKSQ